MCIKLFHIEIKTENCAKKFCRNSRNIFIPHICGNNCKKLFHIEIKAENFAKFFVEIKETF